MLGFPVHHPFQGPLTHLCDLEAGYGGVWAPNFGGAAPGFEPRTSCLRVRSVTITLRGPPRHLLPNYVKSACSPRIGCPRLRPRPRRGRPLLLLLYEYGEHEVALHLVPPVHRHRMREERSEERDVAAAVGSASFRLRSRRGSFSWVAVNEKKPVRQL